VITLRRFDCEDVVAYGRSAVVGLALLFFVARWHDGDAGLATGPRAN